jgi:hypothetical protein
METKLIDSSRRIDGMRTFLPACALLCVIVAPSAAQATSPSADAVIAAAARAQGAQAPARLLPFKTTGTGTTVGLPMTIVAYSDPASGGTNAQYATVPPLSQDTGFDGSSAWTRDNKGVVWVDGSDQGRFAAINEAFRESYRLYAPDHGGAAVALSSPQTDGGRTFDVVRITPSGSEAPFDVWFDRTSHLPARYVETIAAVTTTTVLSDFHSAGGLRIPYSVRQTADNGNVTEVHITRVDLSPPDLAAKLKKPQTDVHDFSIAGANQSTTIPFELIDNHVYLDVMLNGHGPYSFIFDTGGQNVIDPAVVKAIGAASAGSAQGGGVGSATENLSFAPVRTLQIGDAELRDQVFAVLPVREGFGVAGSAPVDGLIGAEVLARFVTVFDYAANRIVLKLPGAPSAGTAVPFVFAGTQPQAPCALDGISTQCTIDSGSRSSIDLHAPFIAAHAAVVPANVSAPGVNGFGVGGADAGRLGRLTSLEIGGFDLKNIIAGFSSSTKGAFAVPGIGGNIGGGVLKRFTVTYDYMHQTMSLEPNAAFNTPDTFDRSGAFVINRGGIVIAAVRAGTPAAAAGLARGDVIAGIDGIAPAGLTLGAIRHAFMGPAGTVLHLTVRPSGTGTARTVELTLRDYV